MLLPYSGWTWRHNPEHDLKATNITAYTMLQWRSLKGTCAWRKQTANFTVVFELDTDLLFRERYIEMQS